MTTVAPETREDFAAAVQATRALGVRSYPPHSHLPEYEGSAPLCVRCGVLGVINPDTGRPFPALGDHGEQVLAETRERFSDLLDGPEYGAALEAVLAEAYLRGKMAGRLAEVATAKDRAARCEETARDTARHAASLSEGDTALGAQLRLAARCADQAASLRSLAGGR